MPKKIERKVKNSLKVISLFSGAGGLDYGLEAAGFQDAVCVEMDKWCCITLRKNRAWTVLEKPIESISSKSLLESAGLKSGEAALLVGGPPCQPFSKAGYWRTGDSMRLDDPRAQTLEEYMRVLEDSLPEAFILENVFGLAYRGKEEGLEFLRDRINRINKKKKVNYSFAWTVLNSAEFGVPQIRERVFIVGHKGGKRFQFPVPRFRDPTQPALALFESQLPKFKTTWDAIGDLDDPRDEARVSKVGGNWGELLPSIPEGENYLWHTNRGGGKPLFGWRTRYWSFLLKLAKNRPSWTIQAQPGTAIGPFHWKNRRLSMREMARIQTFPDDVMIEGGPSNVQRQLGNAVPSLIGEVLGREIAKQFFNIAYPTELKLLHPNRGEPPPAERTFDVPTRYKPVPISKRALEEERLNLTKKEISARRLAAV